MIEIYGYAHHDIYKAIGKSAEEMRALGLEPRTYGLKGRCSTTELHPLLRNRKEM